MSSSLRLATFASARQSFRVSGVRVQEVFQFVVLLKRVLCDQVIKVDELHGNQFVGTLGRQPCKLLLRRLDNRPGDGAQARGQSPPSDAEDSVEWLILRTIALPQFNERNLFILGKIPGASTCSIRISSLKATFFIPIAAFFPCLGFSSVVGCETSSLDSRPDHFVTLDRRVPGCDRVDVFFCW